MNSGVFFSQTPVEPIHGARIHTAKDPRVEKARARLCVWVNSTPRNNHNSNNDDDNNDNNSNHIEGTKGVPRNGGRK